MLVGAKDHFDVVIFFKILHAYTSTAVYNIKFVRKYTKNLPTLIRVSKMVKKLKNQRLSYINVVGGCPSYVVYHEITTYTRQQ
jgi:hypothetical protein